jgi:4-hydroxy-tetrahydrodipicolinate reductase
MLNIALSGANGRMGKAIIHAAKKDSSLNIKVKLINSNNLAIDLLKILKNIDIFIDFSSPNGCEYYLNICKKLKIPMVIGTTGLSKIQHQKIKTASKYIPILYAPNMSISANISYYLLELLTKLWVNNINNHKLIEITDIHHKHKKDMPSGTALKMGDIIKTCSANNLKINYVSKRIGNVKGKHQIKFASLSEELIIKHNIKHRKSFAEGALLAAKWLLNQPKKLYNFSDIIQ